MNTPDKPGLTGVRAQLARAIEAEMGRTDLNISRLARRLDEPLQTVINAVEAPGQTVGSLERLADKLGYDVVLKKKKKLSGDA